MSLKREDVVDWLRHHGLESKQISREDGIRIVLDRTTDEAFIEVHVFKLNSEGRRFVDDMTTEAAKERLLIPLERMP